MTIRTLYTCDVCGLNVPKFETKLTVAATTTPPYPVWHLGAPIPAPHDQPLSSIDLCPSCAKIVDGTLHLPRTYLLEALQYTREDNVFWARYETVNRYETVKRASGFCGGGLLA